MVCRKIMYILSNILRICACKMQINFTKEIIKKIKLGGGFIIVTL